MEIHRHRLNAQVIHRFELTPWRLFNVIVQGMGDIDGNSGTLDIIARTPTLSLLVGGAVREGELVQLNGVLTDSDGSIRSQAVEIILDWEDVASAIFEPVESNLVLSGGDSDPTVAVVGYSVAQALGGRYEIHSGVVPSEYEAVEVIAAADPVPLVIVGAGVLAAACLVGGGATWIHEWIQAKLVGQSADCRAQGGYPKVIMEFKWSFRLLHGEFGCSVKPKFRCERSNGELIYESTGDSESVHALARGAA